MSLMIILCENPKTGHETGEVIDFETTPEKAKQTIEEHAEAGKVSGVYAAVGLGALTQQHKEDYHIGQELSEEVLKGIMFIAQMNFCRIDEYTAVHGKIVDA